MTHFDNVITKPILIKTDDFKQHINKNTKVRKQTLNDFNVQQ